MNKIYHTSYDENLIVVDDFLRFDVFKTGLFFSSEKYYRTHNAKYVYSLNLDSLKTIKASRFFYDHSRNEICEFLIAEVCDNLKILEHDFCNTIDGSKDLDNDDHEVPIGWRLQSWQFEVAKSLGYDCVQLRDEQGDCYLVECLNRQLTKEI